MFFKKSLLLGVVTDEEVAQALGLADCIDDQKLNDSLVSGLTRTSEDLLPHIYKTCWVHYCQSVVVLTFLADDLLAHIHCISNIDKLASVTDAETLTYLCT